MTKNLKQSLNQVVQSIGTDVKHILSRLDGIDDKLNRNAPDFNPKHWRKKATNKMVEVADGLYIDVFEFERVKFGIFKPNLRKFIDNSKRYISINLKELLNVPAGFEPESALWQMNSNLNQLTLQNNTLTGGVGTNDTIVLTHPDVNGQITLTLKVTNRTGDGVQEFIDSIQNGEVRTGDFSLLQGDNVFCDEVVLTFNNTSDFLEFESSNYAQNYQYNYSKNQVTLTGVEMTPSLFGYHQVNRIQIRQGYHSFERSF